MLFEFCLFLYILWEKKAYAGNYRVATSKPVSLAREHGVLLILAEQKNLKSFFVEEWTVDIVYKQGESL